MAVEDAQERVSVAEKEEEAQNEVKEEVNAVSSKAEEAGETTSSASESSSGDGESVIDVSPTGCSISSLARLPSSHAKELYVFDSVFTVLPRDVLHFRNLKVLKLFSNEVKYFPKELHDLPKLQRLQVSASPLGLSSFLPLGKMGALKALELHQLPLRPSASSVPADIAQLRELRRLSICHFSISFLPPEIGSLHNLQELDLSFNKLKFLPREISGLCSLKSLRLANNKLVELPPDISTMSALECIDVGYNRLTSLLSVELQAMPSLQKLNAQFNRLQTVGEIPEWLVCNFEGNDWLQLHSERRRLSIGNTTGTQSVKDTFERQQPAARHERLKSNRKQNSEESRTSHDEMVLLDNLQPQENQNNRSKGRTIKTRMENELGKEGSRDRSTKDGTTDVGLVHKRQGTWDNDLADGHQKPGKRSKTAESFSEVSYKYSKDSFCGFSDYLPDGFYDAGRSRPFVALDVMEKEQFSFESREVILVDRTRDEELDAMASSAKQLLTNFARAGGAPAGELLEHGSTDLYRVAMLALFVSDCFGGSDKTLNVKSMRRAALGSTSNTPFVCSCCSTTGAEGAPSFSSALPSMRALSDEAIRHVKLKRGSNVVPLGSLPYGVCRHRAILLKYLCDRTNPAIPCELVRGYLDYMPHAWNVVLVSRNGVNVRLLLDACRPLDIRPESDPEYFCRYIPMRRIHVQPREVELGYELFVPLFYEAIGTGASGAEVRKCSLGGHIAAAKVRYFDNKIVETGKESSEGGWLSELRIHCSIGEHPNVVSFYGHQLAFDSVTLNSASKKLEGPQLVIFMEYIKGGSLENVIKGFTRDGRLHMPPHLAVCIAKNVARGLVWLHSRGIIHRDIKSSNILVDLDSRLCDNGPVVKICDFDSAVPVGSSSMHTCYLAHHGLPLTDVCVGTPRWIAPEVLDAMYSRQQYGLEADIWSFGCLISELLTLEVPYVGIGDSEIHTYIKAGQRPPLTWQLEELGAVSKYEKQCLQVLIHVYETCTELDPAKRPTAQEILTKLSSLQEPDGE